MSALSDDTRLTYRYDRLRAISSGVIDSAAATFLLLIAVKALQADSLSKSLLAAGGNIGLLLTLWLLPLVERINLRATTIAAVLCVIAAIAFLSVSVVPVLPVYVIGAVIAMACVNLLIPLTTFVYQANYPPRERGRYVSRALTIRVAVAMLAGILGGRLLDTDIGAFRWLLVLFGVALAGSALWLFKMPSKRVVSQDAPGVRHSPFHAMRFIRTDPLLRLTLVAWMLMGFANLMMVSLRVEYLANPKFGIALNSSDVSLYTLVLPNLVRIVLTPVWGWLFDRMNFFAMRILLNVGFALGTAAYFMGVGPLGLALGAIIFGASAAGGELAWSLWVTKFSPPDHVMEYMTVHTFFTGLRGIVAPLLAFQLVNSVSITTLGFLCAAMIVSASAILVPEMRRKVLKVLNVLIP